ncbi:MAG TPA: glycosyltransferase [Xanthobacteraceae bacterium]|jgi:glycosyltransferase involved in cell wall biosynthesis|nr:glycosyltransferase [Xanthobacteraceae bacterium]
MLQANGLESRKGTARTLGVERAYDASPRSRNGVGTMLTKQQPTVSVIIKALNEERRIAATIESALAALAGIGGEVILADGGSTDRTVEIARRYPIVIVRLNRIEDRCCGSGAQLGFQYSRGRFLMLMDGDQELHPAFLPAALAALRQNPRLAGVGGAIIECNVDNEEYEQRSRRRDPDSRTGPVTRLNGSGLYRRSAVESVGYLTDRNLHGGEEFDLGARLHAAGWTLAKIDGPIVDHYPHTGNVYRLLLRRILNKNAFGAGELFRAAIGQRHFWFAIGKDRTTLLCLAVTGWWIVLALAAFALTGWSAVLAAGAILLFPFAAMSLRWRSLRLGVYSVTSWNVFALCFWPGLFRQRIPPANWIASTLVHAPADEPRATHEARGAFADGSRARARDIGNLTSLR